MMILTKGFMALTSEKIDALSGAIPTLKEILWRKKALSPRVRTSYPHLKSANQRPPPVRGIR